MAWRGENIMGGAEGSAALRLAQRAAKIWRRW